MANCLKRFFTNSGSVLKMTQRNRQANCLSSKLSFSVLPSFGDTVRLDLLRSSIPHTWGRTNLPVNTDGLVRRNDTHRFNETGNLDLGHFKEGNILFCARESMAYKDDCMQKNSNSPEKPTPEQLLHISNNLSENLPDIFQKNLDYTIFHKDVVFENNIRGTNTIGIPPLIQQILLLRAVGHFKFARIVFDILKITSHPEDGTVRVRWRIRGISNYKAFMHVFLKIRSPLTQPFEPDEFEGWYDGFSVFYIASDGLVHKVTADKMIPDDQGKVSKYKNKLAAKLGLILGVMTEDFSQHSIVSDNLMFNKLVPCDSLHNLN